MSSTTKGSVTIAVDLGTTAVKAIMMDAAGHVLGSAVKSLSLSTPQPGWSEQHTQDWTDAAFACLRELVTSRSEAGAGVEAVGVSGQMHGAVLVDRDGSVLTPAILWSDQRK